MTDFLRDPGTNGFIITPFTVLTTELDAKTTGSLSTLGAAKTQTTTGNGIRGTVSLLFGGACTPVAPNYVAGWWILSTDGGSTYEKASAALPRAYDFVIPLAPAAYATNDVVFALGSNEGIILPTTSFKVLVSWQAGVTSPATGNTLTIGPFATKF